MAARTAAFIGVDSAIERLVAHLSRATDRPTSTQWRPTGVLTHHLAFDPARVGLHRRALRAHARPRAARRGSMSARCS